MIRTSGAGREEWRGGVTQEMQDAGVGVPLAWPWGCTVSRELTAFYISNCRAPVICTKPVLEPSFHRATSPPVPWVGRGERGTMWPGIKGTRDIAFLQKRLEKPSGVPWGSRVTRDGERSVHGQWSKMSPGSACVPQWPTRQAWKWGHNGAALDWAGLGGVGSCLETSW